MPKRLRFDLTEQQRAALLWHRQHDRKPYLRERSAAILLLAPGVAASEVAQHRLLQPRNEETVRSWYWRYRRHGFAGLRIRPGRGRKSAFAPAQLDQEAARAALLHVVRRDPHQFELERSRWTLQSIRQQLPEWKLTTDGGMHQVLDRLGIHYKRGRSYIHSPDPLYEEKRARQAQILARVLSVSPEEVLLFLDECGIRRHPSVGYNYEEAGSEAPHAQWQPLYDTLTRVMATLDAQTGKVVSTLIGKVTTSALVRLYRKVCAASPQATRIWIVQDTWPVHLPPDVLCALEPQERIYPIQFSPSWQHKKQPSPAVQRRKPQEPLPIQIVQLPTYASWCNPLEKLWRWLKQDLIHLHRCAHDLGQLREQIRTFLDAFATGSHELLHYVGLSSN